jgi:hypothetical protein
MDDPWRALPDRESSKRRMAKKSRRARRRVSGTAQPARISRPVRPLATEAAPKVVDFSAEYYYVVEDLKRIAIIALALLVLLIVLAFVLS